MTDTEILELHHRAPVLLAYMNATMTCTPDGGLHFRQWGDGSPFVQGSLPRLIAGGVDVAVISFGVNHPELFPGRAAVGRTVQQLGAFSREVARHADQVAIARSAAELRAVLDSGRLAVILHLTGVHTDGAIEVLQAYGDLGVRCIHTPFDSVTSALPHAWKTDAGLTPYDRVVLAEMQRLGMVIDLAHANETMAAQIIDLATGPVIISHTMCRVVTDSKRNSSDALHRAVAATGGVVGIHFAGHLIDADYDAAVRASGFREELARWEEALHAEFPDPFAFMAERLSWDRWVQTEAYRLQNLPTPPPLSRIVDHVDHLVQTIGIEHVGLGTDYDLGSIPTAVNSAEKLPNLTRALAERGYPADAITAILGGNFLRVFGA